MYMNTELSFVGLYTCWSGLMTVCGWLLYIYGGRVTSPASLLLLRGRLPAIDNVGCGLMISLLENCKHRVSSGWVGF